MSEEGKDPDKDETSDKGADSISLEEHQKQLAALQSSLDRQVATQSRRADTAEAKAKELEGKLQEATDASRNVQATLDARERDVKRREKELADTEAALTKRLLDAKKAELSARYPNVELSADELKELTTPDALELATLRKVAESSPRSGQSQPRVDTGRGSSVTGMPTDPLEAMREGVRDFHAKRK